MKILATSDIHNDLRFCAEIVNSAIENKVDIITISGDLTNFGTQKELQLVINNLDCQIPVVFTGGNHDSDFGSSKFKKFLAKYPNFYRLQNEYIEIKGVKFYGMPYSLRFRNWWFMCDEKDFNDYLPKEHVDIILAHQPPSHEKISMCESAFGECDIGSTTVSSYLESSTAKYYLCGHVHECGGNSAIIGNTKVINCANSIKIIEI